MFQSRVVFTFWLDRGDDSFNRVQLDKLVADRWKILREGVDKEHRLDDDLFVVVGLNQAKSALKTTNFDEVSQRRLETSNDAGSRVESLRSHLRFICQHFNQFWEDFKVEKMFLAKRIVLGEFTDELGGFASDLSVFGIEARQENAETANLDEIWKKSGIIDAVAEKKFLKSFVFISNFTDIYFLSLVVSKLFQSLLFYF